MIVSTHGRADAAAADRDPTLYVRCRHGASKPKNAVRIVIAFVKGVCPKIDNFISCSPKLRDQFFLQTEPAVIRCNSNAHINSWVRHALLALVNGFSLRK